MKTHLRLRIVPRAPKTEFAGPCGAGGFKLKVKAPPAEGKANRAAVSFIAEKLGISQKNIRILSGAKSRLKLIEITGVDNAAVTKTLGLPDPGAKG